ncbi:glycosyltransferase family 2 protein [Hydrogenobacter thermophilus]|uniref:glycosyltransferase family 2 protein n=1 Tax=Hydrogenobacter thermophilus TaxID=940 RepID=UPI0030F575B6
MVELLEKPKIGELLLQKGLITKEQLEEAINYQKKYGGRLGWILGSLGYVNRLDLFETLAQRFGLEFIDDPERAKALIDPSFLKTFDPHELANYELIPARQEGDTVLLLTSDPESNRLKEFVNKYFLGKKIQQIVITDLDLIKLLEHFFKDRFIDRAVHGLFYMSPEYSASQVFSKGQVLAMAFFIYGSLLWIYWDAVSYLIFVIFLVQVFYVASLMFKLVVSLAGAKSEMQQFITDEEVKSLDEKDLPVYTVLVPVYKEPEVIGILIDSLKKIDYPQNKLDVILLLEEDDKETYEAAKAHRPPINWRFIIVPPSLPKTKPKACNYGLFFARGKYLTIYDAEDVPEPDQLKKAVIAFQKGGGEYICFQAALNYFNKDENFLTKMFTLEYSYWFDYLLPGLYNLKLPIPLGGTSNHFDVEKLREIGAWDPFNTTEDADLGVRAFGRGYKVGVINSTTYEEANARVRNFIRQRSRWVKGYMQTWLVHARNSRKLYKSVGLRGFFAFHLLIGGTPLTFLINPIMWLLFIFWLIAQTKAIDVLFPPAVLYISLFNLLFGNFIGIYLNMLAVFKRKYYELMPYAFLNPIYWILHSIASYKALYELFTKPFYWQKTQHGITKYKPPVVETPS